MKNKNKERYISRKLSKGLLGRIPEKGNAVTGVDSSQRTADPEDSVEAIWSEKMDKM